MSQISVSHILDLISQLPEADRKSLEAQLAERAEAEWRKEAANARAEAKKRGIDQTAIDEAIRKRRYET